ncbi:MAG: PSD1 and planctomycete cytochrome C domain-containing protein [Isosphaeraceae bacterium]|nr:PSD1 and planctomycete cytochrome C domain-containing protein [Isosphaeraceae bacterium]
MRSLPALLLPALLCGDAAVGEDGIDYLRDIKPILAKHCVSCHGEARPRGGLRLDTAALAFKGGKAGPAVVAGNVDESLLLEAIAGDGAIERMPLKRPPVPEAEVAKLRLWIEAGAKAPTDEIPTKLSETHWAFEKPTRPALPEPIDAGLVRNPIDRFIQARLRSAGLTPSPEADRATLIRRVSLDLVGLPPTPEEVRAFVEDRSPDAYERLVDRLFRSPHYGERWARLWLDMARYADSNGYSIDAPRSIWKYRDWVIDAINRDLPYSDFLIEQLAGDLIPNATIDQKVATGFHRNTQINQEGGIDVEQFRVEAVVDRVSTTSSVFLGLTMNCAQCHDHKYDPLTQKEFYRLFAFFNNVDEPDLAFETPDAQTRNARIAREVERFHAELEAKLPSIRKDELEWEKTLSGDFKVSQVPEIKDAFDKHDDMRTESQKRGLVELYLSKSKDKVLVAEFARLRKIRASESKPVTTMVVRERKSPRETYLMIQGDFTRRGETVGPGTPAVLPPIRGRDSKKLDRLDLARWIASSDHPLTARVEVNRMWQTFFGRGIVETENDFGTQGAPPSHVELLDWLACELPARGWSRKALHRLIVTSHTYRQASIHREEIAAADPDNRLLARQSRLRLEAELIRDAQLRVAGLLAPKVGGPSVYPPQPDGVMTLGQMNRPWVTSTGADRYRRGLYTFFWRATPHPGLTVFDAPNAIQACTRRVRSNTPIQALTLLNDAAGIEAAGRLAARVLAESGRSDDLGRIETCFRIALGREPSAGEIAAIERLLSTVRSEKSTADRAEIDAWSSVARVMLNLDEFVTRE